jgi:uncharacterized glyoxalase superfamily protein PhnB
LYLVFLPQLSRGIATELSKERLSKERTQNEVHPVEIMDAIASADVSLLAKSLMLSQAVVNKLQKEPQRVTDVIDVLEANESSNVKEGIQILKKNYADLLYQLESQEHQDSAGMYRSIASCM